MATPQPVLSCEALAQFDQSTDACVAARHRKGSLSTHRSFQSRDPASQQHQTQRHPQSISRRLSGTSLTRRDSAAHLGKRFSFGGWIQGGRSSFSGLILHHPPVQEVRLENTYRTEPEKECRFKSGNVQKLLQTTLDGYLEGASYNPSSDSHLGQMLTDMLRCKVKEVSPPRYKLVCQVVIGQNGNQGLRVASRCLWDDQVDNYAVAVFQNESLYALATVHAVYCE